MKIKRNSLLGKLPLLHLLPYFILVGIAFIWFLPKEPTLQNMWLKCLPILYLMSYLAFMDKGKGDSKTVLPALIFSAIGDGYLAFPDDTFLEGLIAFAIAQVLYIVTFDFKHIRLTVGIAVYGASSLLLYSIVKNLPQYLQLGSLLYGILISTTLWRALDRYASASHLCLERRLCSVLGAIVFMISDTSLVYLQLFKMVAHIPAQVIILSTYYTAQLLLTLGSTEGFWASRSVTKAKK